MLFPQSLDFSTSGMTDAEGNPFPSDHDIFASGGSTLEVDGKQLAVTEVYVWFPASSLTLFTVLTR